MDATRARFGSLLEWGIAAVCAFVLAAVVSLVVTQLRSTTQAIVRVRAEAAPLQAPVLDAPPAAVPSRAVSVPLILLSDGSELRVGEREASFAQKLKAAWKTGVDALERTTAGERLTRAYDDGISHFVLVFEPTRENAELEVSAIYMQ